MPKFSLKVGKVEYFFPALELNTALKYICKWSAKASAICSQ